MKGFTFLLAISMGIALNTITAHAIASQPTRFHPILPANDTTFESDEKSITFKFSLSPNFKLNSGLSVEVKVDDDKFACDPLTIDTNPHNTSEIFSMNCDISEIDKSKAHTWHLEATGVEHSIQPMFNFRKKPSAPKDITCESSSTPIVGWSAVKDVPPDSYRVWALRKDNSSAILLGTVAAEAGKDSYTFKTPIESPLPQGEWSCTVEAVLGNSVLTNSTKATVEFTVPEAPKDFGEFVFTFNSESDTYDVTDPVFDVTIAWNDSDASEGSSSSSARRLVAFYGPDTVSGSVNDARKEIELGSDAQEHVLFSLGSLDAQSYHLRLLGKNKLGEIAYSDVKTFTITAKTAPNEVSLIEPQNDGVVPYIGGTVPKITLKWQGEGWGSHAGDSDESLGYDVSCDGGDAGCAITYDSSSRENTFATATINNPTDGAQITWTVSAHNGNSEQQQQQKSVSFTFKLCEKPSSLSKPFFNKTFSGEISAPELEIGYTALKACAGETKDQLDKVRITFTPTGNNTAAGLRVYEISPETSEFKVPERLPSGPWSVSLAAVAPGYAAVASDTQMAFTSCRAGPLPRPNITEFASDLNDKHVSINFTLSTWPEDGDYCKSSNTLSEIVIRTAYSNTITHDTLPINSTCRSSSKKAAGGATVYDCSYTFVYDVLGTTYISLAAVNPAGFSAYSDPHPAAMRHYTDLESSAVVALFEPEDGACVQKSEAVLTWDPLTLGNVSKDAELDGVEYTVHFGTDGDFSTVHTTAAPSFDVSDVVSVGGHYSWYVVPKVHDGASYTVRTFSVCRDTKPSVAIAELPKSVVLPFTVSWNTTWSNGCGRRSHLIRVNGNVVAAVGDVSSYTFQKDPAVFGDGVSVSISVAARQGDLTSDEETCSVRVHYDLNPPKLSEPKDRAAATTSATQTFRWEEVDAFEGGVTYNFYLKSATESIVVTEISGQAYDLELSRLNSGMYYWSVSAVVYGRESQLAPYRSLIVNVAEASTGNIAMRWPLDNSKIPHGASITFSWEGSSFAGLGSGSAEDAYVLEIYNENDGENDNFTYVVPPCQTSMSVTMDNGTYTWSVKRKGQLVDESLATYSFSVETADAVSAPQKEDGVCCVYPQELRWTGLSADEWGGVPCGSASEAELPELPERACSYMVYVGRGKEDMHFVGRTRGTAYTLPEGAAIRGEYFWTVVADNGFTTSYEASMSSLSSFRACTLMPPLPVEPIIDTEAGKYLPLNLRVSFVAPKQLGDTCCEGSCVNQTTDHDTYFLNMVYTFGSGNFSASFTDPEYDEETGYSYKVFNVPRGNSLCKLSVTNRYGLTSAPMSNGASLSLCESIPTAAPVLNDPKEVDEDVRISTALIDDGKRGKRLTWRHYENEHFGNVCPIVTITTLRLYFWTDTLPKASRVIDAKMEDYILVPFKDMLEKLGTERLDKNTTVYFQMNATNSGTYSAVSEVVELRTVSKDCRDVGCKNGVCDEETLECMCLEGYTGADCSHEAKKGGISDGLKYGLVGLGIFLFIVIVVIVVIGAHYYSKHKKSSLRPPPNFEELRVPPIRRPNYLQNLSGTPDEKLMEKALLDEDGFPLVWKIFRASGVTEADHLAKALLYFYQKQGQGLEFILFLISREISETAEPSVLFRANSPATRAFKFYSKMIGLPYLFKTFAVMLQGIIRDINDAEEDLKEQKQLDEESSAGITLGEIDPDNIDSRVGDENINVLTLQLLCQKFLLQIVRSDKNCPGELKHICAFLKSQLDNKFPNSVYKGVGAFIFLRFYNTAITVPESYGLMENPPEQNVRRQLILISKVLQNLANGVQFGEKEKHMTKLNGFLTSSRPQYEKFINKICDNTASFSGKVSIPDSSYDAGIAVVLSLLYTIAYNDSDKFEALELPQDLHDSIIQTLPSTTKKSKRHKHHKKGDDGDTPLIPENGNGNDGNDGGIDVPPPDVQQDSQ